MDTGNREAARLVPSAKIVNWSELSLPDTWPDQALAGGPVDRFRLLLQVFRNRKKVTLPDQLPGRELIPAYALNEFHNIPNGNYSNKLTRGYITGFDKSMLGSMAVLRAHAGEYLKDCQCVLDVGCAGGKTAQTVHDAGVPEVWGLDPSPYLLKHAATDYPWIHFVQGVMERIPFADQSFDGVSACFVFHEVPPEKVREALADISRVLKPGGRLIIIEPSPHQIEFGYGKLFHRYGWRGPYFRRLISFIHEPFVNTWHCFDQKSEAVAFSLRLVDEKHLFPGRIFYFEKDDPHS